MKARGMSVKKKDEEDEGVADPDGTRRGLMKKEGGRDYFLGVELLLLGQLRMVLLQSLWKYEIPHFVVNLDQEIYF